MAQDLAAMNVSTFQDVIQRVVFTAWLKLIDPAQIIQASGKYVETSETWQMFPLIVLYRFE